MTGEMRRGDWIQVHSGGAMWPLDPRPDEIHIEDVAQSLAHLCRFGGQCREFHCVAQHSVFVSHLCEEQSANESPEKRRLNALAGLLHDAPEAYICDIPRPVKAQLPTFREIEDGIWRACALKWGLSDPITGEYLYDLDVVSRCDDLALVTEKRDLMAVQISWGPMDAIVPDPRPIKPLPPEEARALFMERFRELIR